MSATFPTAAPTSAPAAAVETEAQPDTSTDPSTWGKNYEQMPVKYRKALLELVRKYQDARSFTRAFRIRRATQARYLWRGYHQIWWSEQEQIYKVLGIDKVPEGVDQPRYDYTTNLFRSYGLAAIAVISDGKINVRFWPQNPSQEEDVETAKEASTMADLVEHQNDIEALAIKECLLAYLDPVYAYHIRYVVDGEEYGYDDVDQMAEGQAELGSPHMLCPQCQSESPMPPGGEDAMMMDGGSMPCPNCGAGMGPSDYVPPDVVPAPVAQGTRRFPRGQVRIELISALELDIPYSAKEQREVSDLTWKSEVHRAKLMAVYPHAAAVIRKASIAGDGSGPGGAGRGQWSIDEATERRARMRAKTMTSQSQVDEGLVTFCRTWLRSWALEELAEETPDDKDTKDVLKAAFPLGAYIAYFGDTYIESRSEALDDHWEIANLMPGESLDSEAIGTDEISVQRRHNQLDNITMETYEHGIPPNFAATDVLNLDQYQLTTATPGAFYEVERPAGLRVADGFYTPQPSAPHPALEASRQQLFGPISQHVLGTYPAIYGGDLGGNDTASGIAMQRNQAKGRLGVFYKNMRKHRAHAIGKAVECLRANTMGSLDVAIFDPGTKEFEAKTVHLDELQGQIYAHPESDEGFPASWAEKQQQIDAILLNPQTAPLIFGSPKNMAVAQRLKGLGELEIPGEDARQQQLREIKMMESNSLQGMGPQTIEQGPNPLAPGAMMPPIQVSTVPINPVLDDHAMHARTCREWACSEEGQIARYSNPVLYLDVQLHCQEHDQAMAPPPMPVGAGGEAPGPQGPAPQGGPPNG